MTIVRRPLQRVTVSREEGMKFWCEIQNANSSGGCVDVGFPAPLMHRESCLPEEVGYDARIFAGKKKLARSASSPPAGSGMHALHFARVHS